MVEYLYKKALEPASLTPEEIKAIKVLYMFLILHPQPNWATTLLVDGESAISVVANTPPKTDSFCSANRPFAPKGTDRLQTTIF